MINEREISKSTQALLVNAQTRTVSSITVAGYEGIKEAFAPDAELEANILCVLNQETMLQTWGDCNDFLCAPGWYSSLNSAMPLHGFSVIDAAELNTGEATDCPVTEEAFSKTIVWENADNRINPKRPNQDWINKFGDRWGFGDGKPRFYTMEEA
jgi:hypothetical protein